MRVKFYYIYWLHLYVVIANWNDQQSVSITLTNEYTNLQQITTMKTSWDARTDKDACTFEDIYIYTYIYNVEYDTQNDTWYN